MSAKTEALSASLRAASARKMANAAAAKSREAAWQTATDEDRQAEEAFLGVLDAIARLRATGRLDRYRRAAIAALWGTK